MVTLSREGDMENLSHFLPLISTFYVAYLKYNYKNLIPYCLCFNIKNILNCCCSGC